MGTEQETPIDSTELLRQLRQKEGNWVAWGQACQQLQKAGHSPQDIFEGTGFEPVQQNQVIVAAQVYGSLVSTGADAGVLAHYDRKGSDQLYELRVLNHQQRVTAATLLYDKQLDADDAHEIARSMKEFSRLAKLPEGFTDQPGDTVAYQCWRAARQQSDLQTRSRLIAKGLRFVQSQSARQQLEKLLTDFTVVPKRPAPLMPIYRLESEEEMPRVIPIAGSWPITLADFQAVPLVEETGSFRMVRSTVPIHWMPVPGWKVMLTAQDPVGILCSSSDLPMQQTGHEELVLLVIDRAQQTWNTDSYFLAAQGEVLQVQWFEEAATVPLYGQVILILRPKHILDEEFTKDPWQLEE